MRRVKEEICRKREIKELIKGPGDEEMQVGGELREYCRRKDGACWHIRVDYLLNCLS